MTRFRTVLFWIHLAAGLFAGAVVLVMSVTGVLLTYEKQMIWWADTRGLAVTPAGAAPRLPLEALLARVRAAQPGRDLTAVTVRRDPAAPVVVAVGGGGQLFVDPATAQVLGTGCAGMRQFFRTVTDWHRWLGASGPNRSLGRGITGACNLAFLFLVLSGAYLWLPRRLNWAAFRQVLWFRRGLTPKARDFNWHNVIGVWSALPLALVVASGVVISYPWASRLVYRVAGDAPPAPQPRAPADRASGAGEAGDIDRFWPSATEQVPSWRSISFRVPASASAPLVFTIDAGTAGQPQKRGQLTLARTPAGGTTWEPFASQSAGRRLRSWLRFAHTGEVAGMAGQTLAGLVSAGAVVLVYSGIALSLRRFVAWRRRRRAIDEDATRTASAA